jgi:hypothetical protein
MEYREKRTNFPNLIGRLFQREPVAAAVATPSPSPSSFPFPRPAPTQGGSYEQHVRHLMDMGFTKNQAEWALRANNYNVQRAATYLLGN